LEGDYRKEHLFCPWPRLWSFTSFYQAKNRFSATARSKGKLQQIPKPGSISRQHPLPEKARKENIEGRQGDFEFKEPSLCDLRGGLDAQSMGWKSLSVQALLLGDRFWI